jgi:hypothetical protein
MKNLSHMLSSAALAMCFAAAIACPAEAAVTVVQGSFPQNSKLYAYGPMTQGTTFATTVHTIVPGGSVSFVPTVNDETTAGRNSTQNGLTTRGAGLIEINWAIDGTKATATTGNCDLFINGAEVTDSQRSMGVGEDFIGGSYVVANTTVGAQTVGVYCWSGDTNTFTLNRGFMTVREVLPY